MRTRERVAVGFIDGGEVDGAFAASLFQLGATRQPRIERLFRVEGHLLSRQRNELVQAYLAQSSAEWLLMLDTDHVFTPQQFDALLEAAHDKAAPVVSGLYFAALNRGGLYPQPVPLMFRRDADGSFRTFETWPKDRLIPVDGVGGGCLLVSRAVLEAIRDRAPEDRRDWSWFHDGPVGNAWLSEDLYFCDRIAEAGFPIHVTPRVVLPHHKTYWLDQRHHDAWLGGSHV